MGYFFPHVKPEWAKDQKSCLSLVSAVVTQTNFWLSKVPKVTKIKRKVITVWKVSNSFHWNISPPPVIHDHVDVFVPSWHECKNTVALAVCLLRGQTFTNSHFHFLVILEPPNSQVLLQRRKEMLCCMPPPPPLQVQLHSERPYVLDIRRRFRIQNQRTKVKGKRKVTRGQALRDPGG